MSFKVLTAAKIYSIISRRLLRRDSNELRITVVEKEFTLETV
jgi:hypothetical protein